MTHRKKMTPDTFKDKKPRHSKQSQLHSADFRHMI